MSNTKTVAVEKQEFEKFAISNFTTSIDSFKEFRNLVTAKMVTFKKAIVNTTEGNKLDLVGKEVSTQKPFALIYENTFQDEKSETEVVAAINAILFAGKFANEVKTIEFARNYNLAPSKRFVFEKK